MLAQIWNLEKCQALCASAPERFHYIYFSCLTLKLLTFSRIQLLSCLLIHEVDNNDMTPFRKEAETRGRRVLLQLKSIVVIGLAE